jgi:hypothetical protein
VVCLLQATLTGVASGGRETYRHRGQKLEARGQTGRAGADGQRCPGLCNKPLFLWALWKKIPWLVTSQIGWLSIAGMFDKLLIRKGREFFKKYVRIFLRIV